MNVLGTTYNISTCWTLSEDFSITNKTTYMRIDDTRKLSRLITDPSDYEKGEPKSSDCGEKNAKLAVELAGTVIDAAEDSEINWMDQHLIVVKK